MKSKAIRVEVDSKDHEMLKSILALEGITIATWIRKLVKEKIR